MSQVKRSSSTPDTGRLGGAISRRAVLNGAGATAGASLLARGGPRRASAQVPVRITLLARGDR